MHAAQDAARFVKKKKEFKKNNFLYEDIVVMVGGRSLQPNVKQNMNKSKMVKNKLVFSLFLC